MHTSAGTKHLTAALLVGVSVVASCAAEPPADRGRVLTRPDSDELEPPGVRAPEPSHPIPWDTIIRLERGGCGGECPSYSVELYANGDVVYQGRRHVDWIGRTGGEVLSREELSRLVKRFEEVKFFSMLPYEMPCAAGSFPTATIEAQIDGERHRVTRSYRCRSEREREHFDELADEIDAVARSRQWTTP
jgi:hypothetical protein